MTAFRRAFTLLEVMIVVAILAILAAIVLPNMAAHQNVVMMRACIANLEMLDRATEALMVKDNLPDNADISLSMIIPDSNDSSGSKPKYFLSRRPECPANGEYQYSSGGHCWYCSLGGDETANDGYPHGPGAR